VEGFTMIAVTIDKVDSYVAKLQRKGVKVRWDGWKMVFFHAHKSAERNPSGRRLGDEWGFENIVEPNDRGIWLVNYGLTRGTDASRR
jgi:hypothetical protein